MKFKEKQEKIQQILSKPTDASAKGKTIVVEGKKDELSLRALGICGQILTVKTGGKSFLEVTAEIQNLSIREVVLLLDFDRRGKEGTLWLKQDLERTRIKVNTRFWDDLEALVGKDIRCIEGLPSYMLTLEQKTS
jgi:5S rRNA maturation endonuclease (ribonuclease M5)